MNLAGKRVAVAGMAKSGLSVARAVVALGGRATVFDQKPADSLAIISAMDELHSIDVEAVPGWHGRLDASEFDLLVVSPGFPREHPALADMAGREVLGEIEFAYMVSSDPIIAITGTNGKSTTTVLTWLLLRAAGKDAILCGNVSGSGYPEVTITDAALQGGDVLVAEVSSFQLETISRFRPFVAGITTIAPDHLDRHPSFEDYRKSKMRLFENMGPADSIVVNVDDDSVDRSELPEGPKRIRFSPSGKGATSGFTARLHDRLFLSGIEIGVSSLPLLGEHNVANVMMAWEMACAALGDPSPEQSAAMVSALLQFKGLANRMELIGERDGVMVVNNSMCTNPSAVVASSRGLPRRQRMILGGNRKQLDFRIVGEYLKGTEHVAYLFGHDTEGLNRQLDGDWTCHQTMKEAFLRAVKDATEGDAVVLMPGCASADPYANFRERGDAFRTMAQEWLSS